MKVAALLFLLLIPLPAQAQSDRDDSIRHTVNCEMFTLTRGRHLRGRMFFHPSTRWHGLWYDTSGEVTNEYWGRWTIQDGNIVIYTERETVLTWRLRTYGTHLFVAEHNDRVERWNRDDSREARGRARECRAGRGSARQIPFLE